MPYVIDGNNLIGASPDIALNDPEARSKIVYFIRKFQEKRQNKVLVVFDGAPDDAIHEDVRSKKFAIRYPQYGLSADDEIRRVLESYTSVRDVILVTSDRELKSFAKDKGIKTINSIEFYFELRRTYRQLGKREAKQKRIDTEVTPSEVDTWLKIFNQD